jgi:hypothetical protein
VIAQNFRRFAEALALQMPLRFGHALVWHTSRPTTTWGRRMRKIRGELAALVGRIVYPEQTARAPKPRETRTGVQLDLLRYVWEDVAAEAISALNATCDLIAAEDAGQLRLWPR